MLTIRERMALDIAARHYTASGRRHEAIITELNMTPTRHAQVVTALLDRADAEAEMPAVVRRLRRLRDARKSARVRRDSAVYGVPTGGSRGSVVYP